MKNISQTATKKDLQDLEVKVALNTALQISELEQKMEEKAQKRQSIVMTTLDKVLKELVIIREEQIVGNHQTDDKLKNHEKRIKKLEHHQTI